MLLAPPQAGAVDAFEIQVYDSSIEAPRVPAIEVHVNSVISGRRDAIPPELPPHHQTHFTAEPSIGLTSWWEIGGYLQTTLRADGGYDYAGTKLRSKFAMPSRGATPFGWAVNLEISHLPARYDPERWGGEIRPIATFTGFGGRMFIAANPIVALNLAGPDAGDAPSFEPAVTLAYVVDNVISAGVEYYANLGAIGRWSPLSQQEHYLYEVINVLQWHRWELNIGVGEGLTTGSNRLVGKMIVGFAFR